MRVLFVCTGNICRSPTAEAVFRHKAHELRLNAECDSAGTSAEEEGNPPHPLSSAVARDRGFPMPDRTARRVTRQDFEDFDLLIAMDTGHQRRLLAMAPAGYGDRVRLLMSYVETAPTLDVPDPWYGSDDGFSDVFDMICSGVDALLATLVRPERGMPGP